MTFSIDKAELIEVARRTRLPDGPCERFVAAVSALPADALGIAWEDPEHLTDVYLTRWRELRSQGILIEGLEDAIERFAVPDCMEPIGVIPVLGDEFNYTAFIWHSRVALLGLVEVPASLSSPTPPPPAMPAR